MLARFALDPDAVLNAKEGEHKRLLREWPQFGVLVYNSSAYESSELASAVENLPQAARMLWKQILRRAWLRPCRGSWSGVLGLDGDPKTLASAQPYLDLLCLEETRLAVLRDGLVRAAPNVELSDLQEFDNSKAFERAHELSQKRTGGMTVQKLWQERFALPAALVRNITIVDRFALADGEGINGLEAFFVLLDGAGKKTNVTLYSSYGDETLRLSEHDAQDRVAAIRKRLARGGVGDIKLFLTDSRRFGCVEHDRFIKFDHLVFEIGSGMAIFNGPKVKQSTFSTKTEQAEGHKDTLIALQKLCSALYPVLV